MKQHCSICGHVVPEEIEPIKSPGRNYRVYYICSAKCRDALPFRENGRLKEIKAALDGVQPA